MHVVYARCAGLDVHQKTVSACVQVCEPDGKKRKQVRAFASFTGELLGLADWLREQGVTHVAMEATGVYWRPVWAVLEGQFEQLLVNPQHIKAVPGCKTDAKDCEWIADLLQHGLFKGSSVPPTPIQDLRDLTRYRVELRQSQSRVSWAFPGQIRFNLTSNFDPDRPLRSIGRTFECSGPNFFGGRMHLLFRLPASGGAPDRFLVTLNERTHGRISFAIIAWRSDGIQPISVSVRGARYEAMVLIGATDWIETDLGRWILSADGRQKELETGVTERMA